MVIAPTGHYDTNAVINVGRNYWAFDTQLALTWFDKATGTELSVLSGLMINTMNPATVYRTGTEFHLDFMANQFVAKDIAVGVHGAWYKQIEGDSGAGATLGPFMGESFERRAGGAVGTRTAQGPLCLHRQVAARRLQHQPPRTATGGSVTMSWRF